MLATQQLSAGTTTLCYGSWYRCDVLRHCVPASRKSQGCSFSHTQHCPLQLGALDILQSPISEQADQLSFLAAKWRHMLQKKQPTADIAADFSAGCGDPAPQGFCLDMANLPPLVPPLVS